MRLRTFTITALLVYALLTFYPGFSIAFGIMPSLYITPLTTLTGFIFALLHAGERLGWENALRFLASVFLISLTFESIGVATGWIYGPYHYTEKLGPLFMNLVPILIPVAWFMMSYPSYIIADTIIPTSWKRWQRLLVVSAAGGLAMTAWDLVMDPMMVAGGHWVWEVDGPYFGIPLQNFLGWWATTFFSYTFYLLIIGKQQKTIKRSFDRLAISSYMITALGIITASFFAGYGALGVIGIFSMVPWGVIGWLATVKDPAHIQPENTND